MRGIVTPTKRQAWRPLLLFAVVAALLVGALVAHTTAGKVVVQRAAAGLDRLSARLWLGIGLAAHPRLHHSGWTIVLPRDPAPPWYDEWGRPSEPGLGYGQLGRLVADIAAEVAPRLSELSGLGAGAAVTPPQYPAVVLYESPAVLGPWAAGSQSASGVYFGGVVGIHGAIARARTTESPTVGDGVPALGGDGPVVGDSLPAPGDDGPAPGDGGLASGGNSGPAAAGQPDWLATTLAHELTHWYLDVATSGAIPRWLSEGMAVRAEERFLGAPAPHALIRERGYRATGTGVASLASLVAAMERSAVDPAVETATYDLARSFVAYLDDTVSGVEPGWEGRLAGLLRQGQAFEQAFHAALARDLAAAEKGWLEWLS